MKSHTQDILNWLDKGHTLTKAQCYEKGWGMSLNSRCAELRKRGCYIDCERVKRNGKPVWVYSMPSLVAYG